MVDEIRSAVCSASGPGETCCGLEGRIWVICLRGGQKNPGSEIDTKLGFSVIN